MSYSDTSNKNQKSLDYDGAREKALRLLEFRSHSEKELSDKLKRAGANTEDIENVLEFCREYGFVNDERYAIGKAKDLKNLKKYGRNRIKQELHSKGISAEHIETAMMELEDDYEDILYPLVKKKLGGDFERKNIDKCIRYFIYRGYDLRDIKSCIERIKDETDEM